MKKLSLLPYKEVMCLLCLGYVHRYALDFVVSTCTQVMCLLCLSLKVKFNDLY